MNIGYLILIGGGLLLLLTVMVVFLEATYDAGFEDGFEQGRAFHGNAPTGKACAKEVR